MGLMFLVGENFCIFPCQALIGKNTPQVYSVPSLSVRWRWNRALLQSSYNLYSRSAVGVLFSCPPDNSSLRFIDDQCIFLCGIIPCPTIWRLGTRSKFSLPGLIYPTSRRPVHNFLALHLSYE